MKKLLISLLIFAIPFGIVVRKSDNRIVTAGYNDKSSYDKEVYEIVNMDYFSVGENKIKDYVYENGQVVYQPED